MNTLKDSLKLYMITDRRWIDEPIETIVEKAIQGGVTMVQVREKDATQAEFISIAQKIKKVTDKYQIPLIINDNVEVAVAVDAAGVHIGQDDGDLSDIRNILGEDKIIGLSANTITNATEGEKLGADYLGVGAVFKTGSKDVDGSIGTERLKTVAESVDIPVVAIGGIALDNICQLKDTSIDGVAVISAITKSKDPKSAAEALIKELYGAHI